MRIAFSCSLLIISLLAGCRNTKDEVDLQVNECVGVSSYYIINQSSRSFSVELSGAQLSGGTSSDILAANQAILIGRDSSFGSMPKPTDTFTSFNLYTLIKGKKTILYTQNPVRNERWTKKKQKPGDPDFGCQQVSYTLTITDVELQ